MRKLCEKGFTLVEIMIVVVIVGFLAALAIPAFQKVRAASQNKIIVNNVRQITAAADQYFLENGVTTVIVDDLIGYDRHIKALPELANGDYAAAITQGGNYEVSGLLEGVGGAGIDDHKPTAGSTTIEVTF